MRKSFYFSFVAACLLAVGNFVSLYAQVKSQSLSNAAWVQVGGSIDGRVSGRGQSLAVDPNGVLYYGTAMGGLYRSADKGQTWTLISGSWASQSVGGVAVDPKNPNVIYAGTGCPYASPGAGNQPGAGVYKSTDGGMNWVLGWSNQTLVSYSMEVNPANVGLIYLACSAGVYLSQDAGTAWTNVCPLSGRTSLVIDPVDPSILYAAGANKVMKSIDSGKTWTALSGFTAGVTMTLAMSPANHNYVYLSSAVGGGTSGTSVLSVSTDQGSTWNVLVKGSGISAKGFLANSGYYSNSLAVSPTNVDAVVAGGLFIYSFANRGADSVKVSDWTVPTNAPNYVHAYIIKLAYFQGVLYALTDGGIYHSENNGTSWGQDMNAGLNTLLLVGGDMNLDRQGNPRTFIASAQDNGFLEQEAWEKQWHGTYMQYYGNCYLSPDGLTTYASGHKTRFAMSMDHGISWKAGSSSDPHNLLLGSSLTDAPFFFPFDAADENPNVVALCATDGIYMTTDGFVSSPTDIAAVTGHNSSNPMLGAPTCIAFHQPSANFLYVGTSGNTVYASRDQGATWAKTSSTISGTPVAIATDPTYPFVYIVTQGAGTKHLYISGDLGATFKAPEANLPDLTYYAVAESNDKIFVGGDQGVLVSTDVGVTWQPLSNGMPAVQVMKLKIRGHYLLATTYGMGMYLLDLNQLNASGAVAQSSVKMPALEIYPNPVTTSGAGITIRYSSASDLRTKISILDLLGREREIVTHGLVTGGDGKATAYLSNLTPGQYFVRLTSGDKSTIKPFVIE